MARRTLTADASMAAALSLIPELEHVLRRGSKQKRVEALQRVTALFLGGAPAYSTEHVDLFGDLFALLIEEIESKARAELSCRIAPLANAPPKLLGILAHDDDIAVAGPVLSLSPRLQAADLLDIARTKSQAHLQAIAGRRALDEPLTDILVRRGDREVARSIAGNHGARLSQSGFFRLVKRAEGDGVLAEKVGLRPDIPPPLFRELLARATAVVHARLMAAAPPVLQTEIRGILARVSSEVGARIGPRDFSAAQRLVLRLHRAGSMNEAALAAFAGDGKYEETVAALAALAKVPIDVVDRLMTGERPDPVLILCKAIGMGWSTVKAAIAVRADGKPASHFAIDAAFVIYDRLSASTAQRVVRFWQVRQNQKSAALAG